MTSIADAKDLSTGDKVVGFNSIQSEEKENVVQLRTEFASTLTRRDHALLGAKKKGKTVRFQLAVSSYIGAGDADYDLIVGKIISLDQEAVQIEVDEIRYWITKSWIVSVEVER